MARERSEGVQDTEDLKGEGRELKQTAMKMHGWRDARDDCNGQRVLGATARPIKEPEEVSLMNLEPLCGGGVRLTELLHP